MSKATIELNGKRYDVASGQPLNGAPAQFSPTTSVAAPKRSIDGFSSPGTYTARPQPVATSPTKTANPIPQPVHSSRDVKPLPRHQRQRAKTLVRSSVKRPDINKKIAIKPQYSTDIIAQPASKIVPKHSYYSTDPLKIDRASSTARSQKIQHFSDYKTNSPAPAASQETARVRLSATNDYHQPVPVTNGQHASNIAKRAGEPSAQHPSTVKHNLDDDQSIFDQVLANAKSHEQKPLKRTKKQALKAHRRHVGVGASVLVVVLLGFFIAYQNRANINLQLASAKAGFHATTPSFQPSGYALKDVSASPGMINISYKAPQGNGILIGQKQSNWDSQTLQQNYLALSDQKFQTHHKSGKTIFTYGSHQATWVDGGIWYQIQGNATTDTQELVHIASSM